MRSLIVYLFGLSYAVSVHTLGLNTASSSSANAATFMRQEGSDVLDSSSIAIASNGIAVGKHRGKSEPAQKSQEQITIDELNAKNAELALENTKLKMLLAKYELGPKSGEEPSAPEMMPGNVPPTSRDFWASRVTQQKMAGKQENAIAPETIQHHFDIVINAFKRDFELGYGLSHYTNCSKKLNISKIHVVWGDVNRSVPEELAKYKDQGVEFYVPPNANLTNRFQPLNFLSDAIFHVDDDVYYSCAALEDMFELWRSDPENAIVGANTRKIGLGDTDCALCPTITGDYNMIFATKGAFAHKRFFSVLWSDAWKPMREIADQYNCAEDMMFGWMHLITTGSVDHVYAIAGSVNVGGDPTHQEGVNKRNYESMFILKDYHDHVAHEINRGESYGGLNTRTWGVRGVASQKLAEEIRKAYVADASLIEKDGAHASLVERESEANLQELTLEQRQIIASSKIAHEIRKAFPEHVKKGLFDTYNHRWWRSNKNWALTCRGQVVGCYNRMWKSCSDGCDVPTRGQSSCFTGDSACWAGNMYDSNIDSTDASILVCNGPTDADCQF